jgi:hypothetical protein
MKRWEYKTIKIKRKSAMRRIQVQTRTDGWKIDSVKEYKNKIVIVFCRKEDNE